jgi:hypothetical protein
VRNLFLVLLLANLLLLGWIFWVDPEPPVSAWPAGADELVMFGRARPAAAALSPPVAAASECLFVGPVPDLNAVQQLSASLARRGISMEPLPRDGRVWLGHWVQIQGFADRQAAEVARERLLKAGLPDAYVMQDGSLNIISLGVFRERSRAERVIEAARRAGFEALMRERVRTATEYWLVSGQAGDQPEALAELAAGFDRILRAEIGPCPLPAASSGGSVAPE